jgi:hypothetical protein
VQTIPPVEVVDPLREAAHKLVDCLPASMLPALVKHIGEAIGAAAEGVS